LFGSPPAAASQKEKALPSSLDRYEGRVMSEGVNVAESHASAVIPSTIEAEDEEVTSTFPSMPSVCRL
jgi:hypothetical protein